MKYSRLLLCKSIGQKYLTFDESMLCLASPSYEKIRITNSFEASYGGSEANIALALANPGVDSTFFSGVLSNSLNKHAVRMLRANDVHIGCKGAPDLVMEILSPTTQRHDRFTKFNLYQQAGVQEYWIVDPASKSVQVFVLDDGRYVAKDLGTAEDTVKVNVLED